MPTPWWLAGAVSVLHRLLLALLDHPSCPTTTGAGVSKLRRHLVSGMATMAGFGARFSCPCSERLQRGCWRAVAARRLWRPYRRPRRRLAPAVRRSCARLLMRLHVGDLVPRRRPHGTDVGSLIPCGFFCVSYAGDLRSDEFQDFSSVVFFIRSFHLIPLISVGSIHSSTLFIGDLHLGLTYLSKP